MATTAQYAIRAEIDKTWGVIRESERSDESILAGRDSTTAKSVSALDAPPASSEGQTLPPTNTNTQLIN